MELSNGQIVYYVDKQLDLNRGKTRWDVGWGAVTEIYSTEVVLELFRPRDMRMIGRKPIGDFGTQSVWQRLPRDWERPSDLYTITYAERRHDLGEYDMANPEDLIRAIDDGELVPACKCTSDLKVEVEIDGAKYRLYVVKDNTSYHPDRVSLPKAEVYETYADAKAVIDAYYTEINRKLSLSDYDWAVEEMDETLDRWEAFSGRQTVSEKRKSEVRQRLMGLENFAQIEFRAISDGMQWKYCDKKRWNTVL